MLYHLVLAETVIDDPYAPPSLASEGFVHCSYAGEVRASASLYFPPDAELVVLVIDPAGLPVQLAQTPRGSMPHVHAAIPARNIIARVPLASWKLSS